MLPLFQHKLTRLAAGLALLAPAALSMTGCLRSRVEITSEPSGAEVIWRGQPYGATPVTIPFIWYWHYDFALEKPGYQRLEVIERFRTPPWFLFPTDLIMELIQIPIPDHRERHYVLAPVPAGEPNIDLNEPVVETAIPGAPAPEAAPEGITPARVVEPAPAPATTLPPPPPIAE